MLSSYVYDLLSTKLNFTNVKYKNMTCEMLNPVALHNALHA